MIRNTFLGRCYVCKSERPRVATCSVLGTNVYGDREPRIIDLCGPCRRECKGRCRLHPKHKMDGRKR